MQIKNGIVMKLRISIFLILFTGALIPYKNQAALGALLDQPLPTYCIHCPNYQKILSEANRNIANRTIHTFIAHLKEKYDSVFKIIDTSTSISQWKQEFPTNALSWNEYLACINALVLKNTPSNSLAFSLQGSENSYIKSIKILSSLNKVLIDFCTNIFENDQLNTRAILSKIKKYEIDLEEIITQAKYNFLMNIPLSDNSKSALRNPNRTLKDITDIFPHYSEFIELVLNPEATSEKISKFMENKVEINSWNSMYIRLKSILYILTEQVAELQNRSFISKYWNKKDITSKIQHSQQIINKTYAVIHRLVSFDTRQLIAWNLNYTPTMASTIHQLMYTLADKFKSTIKKLDQ